MTLIAFSFSAFSSRYTEQSPSAWPMTGIRVLFCILRTRLLLPRGMTRSIYWSSPSKEATSVLVWIAWIYLSGSAVCDSPSAMALERINVVWFDSFPPLRMAAFPVRTKLNFDFRGLTTWGTKFTWFDSQSSNVDHHFWPRFKNDKQDSDWTRNSVEFEIIVKLWCICNDPRRIW